MSSGELDWSSHREIHLLALASCHSAQNWELQAGIADQYKHGTSRAQCDGGA